MPTTTTICISISAARPIAGRDAAGTSTGAAMTDSENQKPDPEFIYRHRHLLRDVPLIDPKYNTGADDHSLILPFASYSPWRLDSAFDAAYQRTAGNTLVDLYRCYELWMLAGQMAAVPGDILEVGVWRGGTGSLLAERAATTAPSKRVFLCDTFGGVVKVGEDDSFYRGGEHADTSVAHVEALLRRCGVTNAELLAGIFPEATAHRIADRRFCLCHIDVDVYQSARDVLEWVWPRLATGGVVVFDDYGFRVCEGITRLGNEQIGKPDRVVIHNLNGHAVLIKTA
jgi:O-methyltransferase